MPSTYYVPCCGKILVLKVRMCRTLLVLLGLCTTFGLLAALELYLITPHKNIWWEVLLCLVMVFSVVFELLSISMHVTHYEFIKPPQHYESVDTFCSDPSLSSAVEYQNLAYTALAPTRTKTLPASPDRVLYVTWNEEEQRCSIEYKTRSEVSRSYGLSPNRAERSAELEPFFANPEPARQLTNAAAGPQEDLAAAAGFQ